MLGKTSLLAALCASWVSGLAGQPIECQRDEHCRTGLYCELVSLHCRECRNCEQLQRGPPLLPSACMRSISECGPCFPGLVEDADENCVASEGGGAGRLSPYVWVAAVLGLLLVLAVLVIIVYVLRHVDSFKIRASTRTSVQSATAAAASAPELPPPYHAHYQPDTDNQHDESSRLYSKPAHVRGAAREGAARQAAVVSDAPAYVRLPQPLPGSDFPREEESEPEQFAPQDEDTRESPWTPNDNTSAVTNNNPIFSYLVPTSTANGKSVTETSTTSHPDVSPPPAKIVRLHESNNNREEGGAAPAAAAPAFVINVVQSISAVHQRNDVTL